jgi:hypothetical protein
MVKGSVTFFSLRQFGLYKTGQSEPTKSDFSGMLDSFFSWWEECVSVNDTCTFNGTTERSLLRKKIYCRNATSNTDNGDYVIVLWKPSGTNENGNLAGIDLRANPSDGNIETVETKTENIAYGEPMYYWFIPELQIVASIKFPNSVTHSYLTESYFKSYVENIMPQEARIVEQRELNGHTFKQVKFVDPKDNRHMAFRFDMVQMNQEMNETLLLSKRNTITHMVKRDTIVASEDIDLSRWHSLMNSFPLISPPSARDFRKVEILTEVEPTEEQLRATLRLYQDEYSHTAGEYSNIGFKLKDSEKIWWLDEHSAKEAIWFDMTREQIPVFSAERLMLNLTANRDDLLAGLENRANVKEN